MVRIRVAAMEWAEFSIALAAFLGSHVIPARFRAPLIARFGKRAYVIGYSILSLALLYWLIEALVPEWKAPNRAVDAQRGNLIA